MVHNAIMLQSTQGQEYFVTHTGYIFQAFA